MSLSNFHFSTKDIEYSVFIATGILILAVLLTLLINRKYRLSYEQRWKDIQKLLSKKTNWKSAIIKADNLLDEMLKKRHFKGKTMGERLVSAQHELSANDKVWFSHKLRNKLDNNDITLKRDDVKEGLLGFWLALKDLGAFKKDDK